MQTWIAVVIVVARVIAVFLLAIGATLTALAGIDLYMILANQIEPGEPLSPDSLAPSSWQATVALGHGLAVLGLASLLSWFARRRIRAAGKAGANTDSTI